MGSVCKPLMAETSTFAVSFLRKADQNIHMGTPHGVGPHPRLGMGLELVNGMRMRVRYALLIHLTTCGVGGYAGVRV